jgi:hypothetical protein
MDFADIAVTGSSLKVLDELVEVSTSTDYLIAFLIGSVWVVIGVFLFYIFIKGF